MRLMSRPLVFFYLELPTELDLDLVYCELMNNGSLVQQLVLTKCKDGKLMTADQLKDLCFAGSTTEGKLGDLILINLKLHFKFC